MRQWITGMGRPVLGSHPITGEAHSVSSTVVGDRAWGRILAELAGRADVRRKANPHNFRHSRATFLANHLTEAQMKEYFGWVQSSDMASVYVHLSGRDVDRALLKVYGLEQEEGKKDGFQLKPKPCPRCQDENPATNKFCQRCGMPLDPVESVKLLQHEAERRDADKVLDELLKDEKFRQLFLRKLRGAFLNREEKL